MSLPPQVGQLGRTDPLDKQELVKTAKGALAQPITDDGAGQLGTDTPDGLQNLGIGPVKVDGSISEDGQARIDRCRPADSRADPVFPSGSR